MHECGVTHSCCMVGRSSGLKAQHWRIKSRSSGLVSVGRAESSVSPCNTLAPMTTSCSPSHGSLPPVTYTPQCTVTNSECHAAGAV